jgi:hypothetical protein
MAALKLLNRVRYILRYILRYIALHGSKAPRYKAALHVGLHPPPMGGCTPVSM